MKIIELGDDDGRNLDKWEKDVCYNALDCMATSEVLDVLLPQLDNQTRSTYEFSKSLQGPVLEMRLRGVRVDQARRWEVVDEFYEKLEHLSRNLERIVFEGVGMAQWNWRSNDDLKELFYDRLGIPVIRKQGRPTVNRDALERMEAYDIARPIVAHLIALRELGKKISVLKTEIDPDGRMRTSYNIAGTETGRFSSSFSEFGTGGNLQNIEESLRSIFIADPGMKMGYFDAKSGESFCVGGIEWNLFRDSRFLDVCESGDPHTGVARMCWPELPWTGETDRDKDIAEQPFYRHYTYRFMCKKLGHGSNYGGKPPTLANQTKLPIGVVHSFQPKYFLAFPAHQMWHGWVENQLRQFGQLTTLTGRRRHFFGRRNDDATLREAIAYDPQGSLADIVNRGMLRVWRDRDCQLLMQNHDAIVAQYPEDLEDVVVPKILSSLEYPVELRHGRTLLIPYGAKTGWNFGEVSKDNPDGLQEYKPGDKRKRSEKVSVLDRVVRGIHKRHRVA